MGKDMHALLESGAGADVTFKVEDERTRAHRIILQVCSCVFDCRTAVVQHVTTCKHPHTMGTKYLHAPSGSVQAHGGVFHQCGRCCR
jgi:BTB/POZ domain